MYSESHPQYSLLKQAGMSDDDIRALLKQDFGLRKRIPQKRPLPQPIKPEISKPRKAEKLQKKDLPSSEEAFKKEYLPFMTNTANYRSESEWIGDNIYLLFKLISKVHEKGGIIDVLSVGEWSKLVKQLQQVHSDAIHYSQRQLLDIYFKHLLEFQFFLAGETLHIKEGVKIEKNLSQALFYPGKLSSLISDLPKGIELLMEEAVVFPNAIEQLQIREEDINLAKIEQQCGGQMLDIRIQHPLDFGFNINKLTNIPAKMTIKQYCQYQRNYQVETFKKEMFGDQLKHGKIFFGVNFQPENIAIFDTIWSKITGSFLGYKQKFDLLSYLDEDIPGCSTPQFYLKVKGCWTGGHQENVNMCAININHGPDPSEWLMIPFHQVEKLRKVLIQKFKCDLFRDEGLWFQKINWFIENGFSVKRILQKKGDAVVTGPGTMHWVRSHGVALQSAWNIFPKTFLTFQRAIHRHEQNVALSLQKKNVIPLKSLLLKYIDHELFDIQQKSLQLILSKLEQWDSQEERLRLQLQKFCDLTLQDAIQHRLDDLLSVCVLCRQQIFKYFVNNWIGDGIVCLQCLRNHFQTHMSLKVQLFFKYNQFQLKSLLSSAQKRHSQKILWTNSKLCGGIHIGDVQCPMKLLSHPKQLSHFQQTQPLSQIQKDTVMAKIQKLMELNEKYPLDQKKTVRQLIDKNNLKDFSQITNTNEIQIQTDDLICPYCDETQSIGPKPSKKHKYNEDHQSQSNRRDGQSQRHRQSHRHSREKEEGEVYQRHHHHHRDQERLSKSDRKRDNYEERNESGRDSRCNDSRSHHGRDNERNHQFSHNNDRDSRRNDDRRYRNNDNRRNNNNEQSRNRDDNWRNDRNRRDNRNHDRSYNDKPKEYATNNESSMKKTEKVEVYVAQFTDY